MILSGGEIEALARKAARGSGMSWGLAEEAGHAVRWLESWGFAGADALVDVLRRTRRDPPVQDDLTWRASCPITLAAALSDRAAEIARQGVDARADVRSLFLLPALAHVARREPLMLSWPGGRGFLGIDEVWLDGRAPDGPLRVRPGPVRSGVKLVRVPPRALPRGVLDALTEVAGRTYAPAHIGAETGAGACQTDND